MCIRDRVEDCVGLRYLAVLMANPEHEIPALDLVAGHDLPALAGSGDPAQPVLDEVAVRGYRRRLAAVRVEIDEYESRAELTRAELARAERDWLVTELGAATGLRGRVRHFGGAQERARVAVGKAIRRALTRIESVDPALADRLRDRLQTGARCCYRPY